MLPSGNDAAYALAENYGQYLEKEAELHRYKSPDNYAALKLKSPV